MSNGRLDGRALKQNERTENGERKEVNKSEMRTIDRGKKERRRKEEGEKKKEESSGGRRGCPI